MINRKCSRCKEITGTLHGGKKNKEEFLCEDCLQKGIESGEIELSQVEQEQTSYLSIKILKIMSVIYLIASIFMAFSTGPFIHNIGFDEMSISGPELGLISIVMLGSLFQSVLVFCGIWVFILLVETVIKIYEKMK
ncbi:TPA: DUF3980 domain-containing protein [Bacillus pacificus]|uniref:DUF3980 domain-containing protein n=1 Tax=Bacillus pacificus TaxID=2026187 RepID=A0A1Y6AEK7_9BACI|nr:MULTISPECIES: DUF3980 domain-containing protein [Bacillus cereus group]AFQ11807.1 hypothetical protein BCK_19600 [Bacillus cereus FRI-35]MDA1945139.1 DUF3980 domain-containing protein [Bacillus cereus group sp. BcHK124]UTG86421.1 DUF3980 domain-containing protein [Bacillus pacificus]SME32778.1 hypothetical protein BACERE00191_04588 [Bacillus pacificus]HDR7742831.1 DUF3980 domain-containing protein [Bacillus pacificus]